MEAKGINGELEIPMHEAFRELMLLLEHTIAMDDGVDIPYMRNIRHMDQVAI